MDPLPAFFLLSTLVILPLAWLGGGHTERAGAALYLCMSIPGPLVQRLQVGNLPWALALIDLAVLAGLVWLALGRDRWWPLVAVAFQVMTLMLYAVTVWVPELNVRSLIVANMVLGILVFYCLLGGVLERILAGEAPASASAVWTRLRPTRPTPGHQPP